MHRRTLLKAFGALFVARRAARPIALPAQAASPAAFSPAEINTLGAIAEVALPSGLTADDRRLAVRSFVAWFANYRPGADMGHGYGSSNLRAPSGPSPIARYPAQFASLDEAAKQRGAAAFAALPIEARREIVEDFLNTPQPVGRMPAQPTGANLVADFMGAYFNSQDGWNLCYRAEINRDACRRLEGSEKPPARSRTSGERVSLANEPRLA
jgi:hypothetical protein